MAFGNDVRTFAATIPGLLEHLKTEESTKTALVQPFLKILGYNPHDPREVMPEQDAQLGVKLTEKVDYGVYKDGKLVILIECKWAGKPLEDKDADQLRKYYAALPARLGVLTNGIHYWFFHDVDKENIMDTKPFLRVDLLNLKDPLINRLEKFAKTTLSDDAIKAMAIQLKYTDDIKRMIDQEFRSPSDEFVKFIAERVYPGKLVKRVVEQFKTYSETALNEYLGEKIRQTLDRAIEGGSPTDGTTASGGQGDKIDMPSEEEMQAWYVVRAILCDMVDPTKVSLEKRKAYCNLTFEGNQQKPICRFRFEEAGGKQVGLVNEAKAEVRYTINGLTDIYQYAAHLRDTVSRYLNPPNAKGQPVAEPTTAPSNQGGER